MPKLYFCKSFEVKSSEQNCFQNGLPAEALMEKAGLKIADLFKKIYSKKKFSTVGIVVGPGHNGADALVVARELFLSGYKTCVFVAQENLKPLTSDHLKYYIYIGGIVANNIEQILDANVLVDGLFGFGLQKTLEQQFIELIETINNSKKEIVSIDIPSGLNTDYGIAHGACVQATHTFCLGLFKQGLVQDFCVNHVGKLHFVDIGISQTIPKNDNYPIGLSRNLMELLLKQRNEKKRNLHKYSNGVSLLFAGSNKYPGAGILSAKGAMAAGVGYCQLSCTNEIKYSAVNKMPDIIYSGFKETLEQIEKHIQNVNFSILCGSGLENPDCLSEIIGKISSLNIKFPCLILDATCLDFQNFNLIKNYKGPKILTPHGGEFSKFFPFIAKNMHKDILDEIKPLSINKIDAVKIAAKEISGIVLLKGPHTIVANEFGQVFVDIHSTSALARAGCGDVLAGYLSGLVAKGYSPINAACLAVYKQSQTAIALEKEFGKEYVSASNLVKNFR